ncbi:MAG: hypothetical protein PHX80_05265 [Candidatus Nanoarchaeia archaeon]|nr:hypothetical protein [Candidatus Nanoarchaeia archaeon]
MKTLSTLNSIGLTAIAYLTFICIDAKQIIFDMNIFIICILIGLIVFGLHFSIKAFIEKVIENAINKKFEENSKILLEAIEDLSNYVKRTNIIIVNEIERIKNILYSALPISRDLEKDEQFQSVLKKELETFEIVTKKTKTILKLNESNRDKQ